MKHAGLYVHIPFCEAKCHYCDFVTFVDKNSQIDSYLKALEFELSTFHGRSLKTLFIGGGTPTVLTPQQIGDLFKSIYKTFDCSKLREATVEANPESATTDKLSFFKENGINRLSLGLQTTNNESLEKLGRLHNREKFFQVYDEAVKLGIKNINIDLMFGLPGQTVAQWEKSLDEVLNLRPQHISTYSLKIENGTEFYRRGITIDHDLQADMYLLATDKMTKAGYSHYEISNYALPGYESEHNLRYWKNEETIGAGVSSTSFLKGERIKNTNAFRSYMESCLAGQNPSRSKLSLDDVELSRESVMLNLRLKSGVDLREIQKYHVPLIDIFLDKGLAQIREGRYSLTPRGWLVSNQLFQHFVS